MNVLLGELDVVQPEVDTQWDSFHSSTINLDNERECEGGRTLVVLVTHGGSVVSTPWSNQLVVHLAL